MPFTCVPTTTAPNAHVENPSRACSLQRRRSWVWISVGVFSLVTGGGTLKPVNERDAVRSSSIETTRRRYLSGQTWWFPIFHPRFRGFKPYEAAQRRREVPESQFAIKIFADGADVESIVE